MTDKYAGAKNFVDFVYDSILSMTDEQLILQAKKEYGENWQAEINKARNMLLRLCDEQSLLDD